MCGDCFEAHCKAESSKDLGELQARNAQVFCPWRRRCEGAWSCSCEQPYPQATVAAHVSAAAFEVVLNARERVQEKELTQQFEERMAIER